MHTKSHMKNCDYIIHAVGPNMDNYHRRENDCYEKLFETFLNVFMYAEEVLKVQSIAVPLISSGIFSVPKDVCCDMLYKGLQAFISNTRRKANRNLKCIKVVSIDAPTNLDILKSFKKKMKNLKGFDDESKLENKIVEKRNEEKIINKPNDDEITLKNKIVEKQDEEEEIIGKCKVCEKEKKLKISLECGCKYCHQCKDNYIQNGNKCFCADKDEEIIEEIKKKEEESSLTNVRLIIITIFIENISKFMPLF